MPNCFEHVQQHSMALGRAVVALFVMAVARVAGQDQDAVGSLAIGLQHELRVHAAAAHHADDAHVRRIGRLRRAGFVGAGVGAPVAQEADDFRARTTAAPSLRVSDSV